MHTKHDTEVLPPLTQLAYAALEPDDLINFGVLGSDMVEGTEEIHRLQHLIAECGWKRQKRLERGRYSHNIEYRVYKRKIDGKDRWLTIEAGFLVGPFAQFETYDREP